MHLIPEFPFLENMTLKIAMISFFDEVTAITPLCQESKQSNAS
jgi:hypothetical protein